MIALATVLSLFLVMAPGASGQWSSGQITGLGATQVTPYAVNAHGVVVGNARLAGGDYIAFRWEDGEMIALEEPGGSTGVAAYDINDDGDVVGAVSWPNNFSSGAGQGIKWTTTKTTSSFSLLGYNLDGGGPPPEDEHNPGSAAYGINNDGNIVGTAWGTYTDNEGNEKANFFPAISGGGAWTKLISPESDEGVIQGGSAHEVNEQGKVLGTATFGPDRAFLTTTGGSSYTVLQMDAGFPSFQGLNDAGKVAGVTVDTDFVARLWNGSGYDDVGSDQSRSLAMAINESDWAVGRSSANRGDPPHFGTGYLWRPNDVPTRLNQLAGGFAARTATDINDDGMIVGVGDFPEDDSFFEWSGFWMAPASVAYPLDGTVTDSAGRPVAGARLRIVRAGGEEVTPVVTTDSNGYYETTLRGGEYDVIVLPAGTYAPDPESDCTITGTTCRILMDRPQAVDFGAASAPDTEPPGLRLPANKTGGDKKKVTVQATCDEACSIKVKSKGKAKIKRSPAAATAAGKKVVKKKLKLKPAQAELAADQPTKLKLRFKGRRTKRIVKRALKKGKKIVVGLKAVATDSAGNRTAETLKARIKG